MGYGRRWQVKASRASSAVGRLRPGCCDPSGHPGEFPVVTATAGVQVSSRPRSRSTSGHPLHPAPRVAGGLRKRLGDPRDALTPGGWTRK